jgi:hypothetical protein
VSEAPIDTVVRIVSGRRYQTATEADLQEGLALVLAPHNPEREVVLGPHDRVDFLLWGVGVEVKIKGSTSALTRQLWRYAKHDRIRSLLVVTTRERHRLQLPSEIDGKPVRVVSLMGAFA